MIFYFDNKIMFKMTVLNFLTILCSSFSFANINCLSRNHYPVYILFLINICIPARDHFVVKRRLKRNRKQI